MRYDSHHLRGRDYFASDAGLLAQHRVYRRRRLYLSVYGVEPRRKGRMSAAEEISLQTQILDQMEGLGRLAYRGPLVLDMSVDTTERNPPQAHSIAKNLLDLFSTPRSELGVSRKLIYGDDVQIEGLSFWCSHGQEKPRISIAATPLADFRADLAIAVTAERKLRRDDRSFDPAELHEALDYLKWLLDEEQLYRGRAGDRGYASVLEYARFDAQQRLLGGTATRLLDLAAMYQVVPRSPHLAAAWEQMNRRLVDFFQRHRLRILLQELPSKPGTSKQYIADVNAQIGRFYQTWRWVLKPLQIPLALQVITRPSPSPDKVPPKNDLDNVVRNYVIPTIIETFAPPSDFAWARDLSGMSEKDAAWWTERRKGIPAQPQVRRYEAWRLPVDGTRGFVSVSLVPDIGDLHGPLMRIDEAIESWQEAREREADWG